MQIIPPSVVGLRFLITGVVNVLFMIVCSVSVVAMLEVAVVMLFVVANVAESPEATAGMLIIPPSLACLSSEIIGVDNVLFDNVCGISVVAISFEGTVVEDGG